MIMMLGIIYENINLNQDVDTGQPCVVAAGVFENTEFKSIDIKNMIKYQESPNTGV